MTRKLGVLLATVDGLDGGEVFIVATNLGRASANRKVGDAAQVWSIPAGGLQGHQRDVCGSCPLMPQIEGGQGGCYVAKLFMSGIWRAIQAGAYPAWDGDTRDFDRLHIRFGAWGDPCLLPLPIVERIARASLGWMGYSHEWKRPEVAPYARYFMASVHTAQEAAEATSRGWRWFMTPFAGEAIPSGAIQCPHQTRGIQCRDCRLCDGHGHGKTVNIWNTPHGPKSVLPSFNQERN